MDTVGGEGWEIKLPPEWVASDDGEFITLIKSDDGGAVTISAMIDEEEDFSLDELEIYAKSKLPNASLLKPSKVGDFSGFTAELEDEEGIFWHHSWLVFEDLLIYFSYNGMPDAWEDEKKDVNAILKSLKST